jgi:hypothetical protein
MATTVVTGTTLKVNGAVNATGAVGFNTTSGALYTAPSSGYAIIQASITCVGANNGDILVGGRSVYRLTGSTTVPLTSSTTTASAGAITIYVGPSQAVQIRGGVSTSCSIEFCGVEFINSP